MDATRNIQKRISGKGNGDICLATRGNEPNLSRDQGLNAIDRVMRREKEERRREIKAMREAAQGKALSSRCPDEKGSQKKK